MTYAHAQYAHSLAEFGSPRKLTASGGWVLIRDIPGAGGLRDAMGCYPLFACPNWAGLPEDIEALRADGVVSLVLVADPLTSPPADLLAWTFDGVCRPFKTHYLVDLQEGSSLNISEHHRREISRSAGRLSLEVCGETAACLEDWNTLYAILVKRRYIKGFAAFSPEAFAVQFMMQETLVTRALDDEGTTVAMQVWMHDRDKAWYHLSAQSESGYRLSAGFTLMEKSLELLRDRGVKTVDLGSGQGLTENPQDGLSRFKAGWATRTTRAWLCGSVLDRAAYAALAPVGSAYFPAYRDPVAAGSRPREEHVHAG